MLCVCCVFVQDKIGFKKRGYFCKQLFIGKEYNLPTVFYKVVSIKKAYQMNEQYESS